MTARIEGVLESVGPQVTGWARLPADPAQRLRLSILLDSGSGHALRLDTVADLHRGDLESVGKGDGRHGFAVAVPAAFADCEHDVDVRLPDAPGMRLTGSPRRTIPTLLGLITLHALRPEDGPANGAVDRLRDLLAGMVRLHGGTITTAVPDADSIRFWLSALGWETADRGWLVAERNGRFGGHCRIGPGWPAVPGSGGLALGIELHPDVRGRGLGHALMRAAERWADGRGTRLELAVLPHNTPALALYLKLGYADLGPVAHPVTGEAHRHMALPLPSCRPFPRRLSDNLTLVL